MSFSLQNCIAERLHGSAPKLIVVQCGSPKDAQALCAEVQRALPGERVQHVHYFAYVTDPALLDFEHLLATLQAIMETTNDNVLISGSLVFANQFIRETADLKLFVKYNAREYHSCISLPDTGEASQERSQDAARAYEQYLRYVLPLYQYADMAVTLCSGVPECDSAKVQVVSIPATPFEERNGSKA